jgi:hypothetical protein
MVWVLLVIARFRSLTCYPATDQQIGQLFELMQAIRNPESEGEGEGEKQ